VYYTDKYFSFSEYVKAGLLYRRVWIWPKWMKVTKCVNNRRDVNYIGKYSNSYILGSIINYKSATGFKVSDKCKKL